MSAASSRPDVRLVGHPGRSFSWPQFCQDMQGPAVGIDGCVRGRSQWSADGLHMCLNHHEGSPRLFCRATCGQSFLAVQHGLWDRMSIGGVPGADIHLNDADPDVCTSVFVLAHPERLDDTAVERLVAAEDMIDTTAAFSCPSWVDDRYLSELTWVFEPYFDAREAGLPEDEAGLLALVEEVVERVAAHVDGRGGRRRAWGDYDLKAQRGEVVAVVEHGPYARMALRRAGVNVIVAERRTGERRHITLAKASPFSGPDLAVAYDQLNDAENCPDDDRWGGSDLVGGSPRRRGTALALEAILEIVADA